MCKKLAFLFLGFVFVSAFFNDLTAQSCTSTYPGGATNWTALSWSCSGGGSAPSSNGATYTEDLTVGTIGNGDNLTINISFTLNGNLTVNSSGSNPTITIPAGVVVVINGDLTDNDNNVVFVVNGTLLVSGTLKAKNNTSFSGSGTISGGTLDLGNGPSCSGSCPGLTFGNCTAGGGFCGSNVTTASVYLWNGSASTNWQTSTNWTPTRTTPATADVLNFTSAGANRNITNVPTQTVGKVYVTGSTSYSFTTASSNKTLTLSSTAGTALQIDNGSTLVLGNASFAVNLTMPTGGLANIGGQLNLTNGNFGASGATVELHTNPTPLARTAGQMSMNSSSVLKFGTSSATGGNQIVLPDNIFVSAPTISSLTINRTNGAALGNQSITVSSAATFTLGNLTTNAAGRLIFASTASNPTESSTSKIIGYAEMSLRAVGTGALNFLGFNMAAGADNVGSMSLVRRTGSTGINTFNANQSIASTWDVVSVNPPTSGRNVAFSWQAAFDNVTTPTSRFQAYIFNSGPGWTTLGSLQNLSAQGPPRQSVSVSTTKLSDTFTLTDESQSLPVTLLFFKAQEVTEGVELSWATASELNFDYFAIERSTDDEDFQEIGRITGNGTTDKRHDYLFIDNFPLSHRLYYRLKSVDFDGYTEYFKMVSVDFNGERKMTVYPNPVSDGVINVLLNFTPGPNAEVLITDIVGVEKVKQVIPGNANEFSLPVFLEAGAYLIRVKSGGFLAISRILLK